MYLLPAPTLALLLANTNKDVPLTHREAASGILGSISMACWLFLLLPQLIENYRNQSAEAISLAFIVVWFVGDLANLTGALWASLVPTVIAIAVYYCLSDGVLIGQILYYGIRNKRREGRSLLESVKDVAQESETGVEELSDSRPAAGRSDSAASGTSAEEHESSPLLARKSTRSNSITIPGSADLASRRRSSATSRRRPSSGAQQEPLSKILEEDSNASPSRLWLKNLISIIVIFAVGSVGWLLAYESGAWRPTPAPTTGGSTVVDSSPAPMGASILGYISAVAYLGARIPQIVKNAREKSCEGLSLLFFILSLLGNATYGAGILCHSTERQYFMTNLPWLIGSLGTMVEDVTIFVQFRMYKNNGLQTPDAEVDDSAVIT